ncbi:MAG: hypothetical protein V2A54_09030 [Bacteroidota bacterium]
MYRIRFNLSLGFYKFRRTKIGKLFTFILSGMFILSVIPSCTSHAGNYETVRCKVLMREGQHILSRMYFRYDKNKNNDSTCMQKCNEKKPRITCYGPKKSKN